MCVFDGTYYKITTTNYISKTSLYTTTLQYENVVVFNSTLATTISCAIVCINICLLMFFQYCQLSHYIFGCNICYHHICQFNNYFVNICILMFLFFLSLLKLLEFLPQHLFIDSSIVANVTIAYSKGVSKFVPKDGIT